MLPKNAKKEREKSIQLIIYFASTIVIGEGYILQSF